MALFKDGSSPIAESTILPPDAPHPSWLHARPTVPECTLSDQEFATAIRVRFCSLSSFPLLCAADHGLMAPDDFTNHVMGACRSCSSLMENQRHQAIVAALRKSLCRFNIPSQILDAQHSEFPLPGNAKGGPDLLVTSASKVFAVDVTVAKEASASQTSSSVQNAYSRKIRNYIPFAELTSFVTAPFVMSHVGVLHAKSVEFLQQLAPHAIGHRFLASIITSVQFALLRSTHKALFIQRQRVAVSTANVLSSQL
jgi:hypothetical protein